MGTARKLDRRSAAVIFFNNFIIFLSNAVHYTHRKSETLNFFCKFSSLHWPAGPPAAGVASGVPSDVEADILPGGTGMLCERQ
jgi:hypothetical protein